MNELITTSKINEKIHHIRGSFVMLDHELAQIYGVETKTFNQAVKRNIERFPDGFRFQLTDEESQNLRSQFVTSSLHGGRRYLPYVFTEQGVAMLSAILKSKTAVEISIQIMQTFVQMRALLTSHEQLVHKINHIEHKQTSFEIEAKEKFEALFSALEDKTTLKNQGVFFDGQIFDAHTFVSDLIRKAKKSIILLDNYIDDTVLTQLSKSNKNVKIYILTKNISNQLKLDAKKYGEQYSAIELIEFNLSHDRFLIIDDGIYHIGASLKDLGKKWFAFSKLENNSFGIMEQINNIIQENKRNRG